MERIQLCVHPILTHVVLVTVSHFDGRVLPACSVGCSSSFLQVLSRLALLRVDELLYFRLDVLVFLRRTGSWRRDRALLQD